mmetsp:Transcript_31456/g.83811  ORF Transcript_31456/g.83811 Transcript_31456/m.83811 type:complete len:217 (-) Transcript_31456:59-709(-)
MTFHTTLDPLSDSTGPSERRGTSAATRSPLGGSKMQSLEAGSWLIDCRGAVMAGPGVLGVSAFTSIAHRKLPSSLAWQLTPLSRGGSVHTCVACACNTPVAPSSKAGICTRHTVSPHLAKADPETPGQRRVHASGGLGKPTRTTDWSSTLSPRHWPSASFDSFVKPVQPFSNKSNVWSPPTTSMTSDNWSSGDDQWSSSGSTSTRGRSALLTSPGV